jgi:hypothetical protein
LLGSILIQNSAHDSIGGCSLDDIHDDMMNRYKQSIEISKAIFERASKHLVKSIDTASLESENRNEDIFITVLNPNNSIRSEVIEAIIDIPEDLDKGSFAIHDDNYKEIPFEILKRTKFQPVLEQMIDRPMYFDMIRYRVNIFLKEIPGIGYRTFKVTPQKEIKSLNKIKPSKKLILSNEHLEVKINKNGTFNINDLDNGKKFTGLGYFYDEGEAGHAWVNDPVKPFINTLKSKPKIKIVSWNQLSKTILIEHNITIPKSLSDRKKKKINRAEIKIKNVFNIKI